MNPVSIDVVSDVVCPWCFVGKRRLEGALKLYAEMHPDAPAPTVTWHPFQLNPDLPVAGASRAEHMAHKFGARAGQMNGRLIEVGNEVGIPFAFDRITQQPNTLAAHSLVGLAQTRGRQDEVVEALFRAFFIDGVDLTAREALLDVVTRAGLDRKESAAVLDNDYARDAIAANDARARELGIQGVPFFIFNGRLGVSGAQPAAVLVDAMKQAASGTGEP